MLMLIASSAQRGEAERGTTKVFGRKKRLEILVQVYMDDIHVIDIFFVGHTMQFLGIFDTRSVDMRVELTTRYKNGNGLSDQRRMW